MTTFGAELNKDSNSIKTSADNGDPGDGVTRWFTWVKGFVFSRLAVDAAPDADNAPLNDTSVAYVAAKLVKNTPGIVYGLSGYNSKASAQFIQVHDSAIAVADAQVPEVLITVPAESNFSIDFGVYGRFFAAGIYINNSSTGPTKTVGAADCWFDVQYR